MSDGKPADKPCPTITSPTPCFLLDSAISNTSFLHDELLLLVTINSFLHVILRLPIAIGDSAFLNNLWHIRRQSNFFITYCKLNQNCPSVLQICYSISNYPSSTCIAGFGRRYWWQWFLRMKSDVPLRKEKKRPISQE